MSRPNFDAEALFDDDYLYFYEAELTAERSDAETSVIWRLLGLEPGHRVLDLACGHGRIANRLAARGCQVTGLDATALFLDRARRDAAGSGVTVEYVQGDMRRLPWTERFDRVVNWFTAFGYFTDEDNRRVLGEIARVLRPGGKMALDIMNRDWLIHEFQPVRVAAQRGHDRIIDHTRIDPLTGRAITERIVERDGRRRTVPFFVRLFTYTELCDWLLAAGFSRVDGYGEEGTPLTTTSRRMIVVAQR
jgi:SAM-dependent methyltransferase